MYILKLMNADPVFGATITGISFEGFHKIGSHVAGWGHLLGYTKSATVWLDGSALTIRGVGSAQSVEEAIDLGLDEEDAANLFETEILLTTVEEVREMARDAALVDWEGCIHEELPTSFGISLMISNETQNPESPPFLIEFLRGDNKTRLITAQNGVFAICR